MIYSPCFCCCGFKQLRKRKPVVILVTKRVSEMDLQAELWRRHVGGRYDSGSFKCLEMEGCYRGRGKHAAKSQNHHCDLIKMTVGEMWSIRTQWRQSPSFCYRTLFSHHLLLAMSNHWFRGRKRKSDMIGCPFCFPPFVAMGDTFLLLMQYQHCRNCFWFPPYPATV